MAAVAGVVWLLALISVRPSLGTAGPLPTVRLGVLEPSWLDDAAAQRLALLLLPIVALLAGAATAGLARSAGPGPAGQRGHRGWPVRCCVAFAYLTAGPGDAVDRYQVAPYYGSLIAILAGALGAAAAALLRWPTGTAYRRSAGDRAHRHPAPAAHRPGPARRRERPGQRGERPGRRRAHRRGDDTTPSWPPVRSRPASSRVRGRRATPRRTHRPGPLGLAGDDRERPARSGSDDCDSRRPEPRRPDAARAWLTEPTGEFTAGGQTPPRQ